MQHDITFRPATAADALFIARGFHTAMLMADTAEERVRTFAYNICTRDDVLYSPRNTTIAMLSGRDAGMLTAYDGSRYEALRSATWPLLGAMGLDFPTMEAETEVGEWYLDSLAVVPECRSRGVGTALLRHAIAQGAARGLTPTLAVDPANARAQRLYRSLGFRHRRDIFIFSHTYWKWAWEAR